MTPRSKHAMRHIGVTATRLVRRCRSPWKRQIFERLEEGRSTSMRRSVRILVVDDFGPFRSFVRTTLQKHPELEIIGEASDGLEAIQKLESLKPDPVLLDIGPPKLSGIEIARQIRVLSPGSKFLMVTEERSEEVIRECLWLGASGYLVKSDAAWELELAINSVIDGTRFLSTSAFLRPG